MTTNNLYSKALAFLSMQNVKDWLLWIISISYADSFIRNGFRKFDPEGFWSHSFLETWGFPLWFMYLIGVLEFVSGILLLVPKTRPLASWILALVMFGALMTRSISSAVNGIPVEDIYNFIQDVFFFFASIAMFLFFISYSNSKKAKTP